MTPDGERDVVRPADIEPQLRPPIGGPLIWMTETGSTNDVCVSHARAGTPQGLVVGADHQTGGRGRRGRTWVDAPGHALMFSVLLRPALGPDRVGLLPIVVAVAVADAISAASSAAVEIAWPNDVLIDGRKVAGILCEVSLDRDNVAWAVVGIGINVASVPEVSDARWQPGCLADAGVAPCRPELLVSLLSALDARYAQWLAEGSDDIVRRFSQRDHLAGRRVSLRTTTGTLDGEAVGLDPAGCLMVDAGQGVQHLAAAEVVRVFPS